STVGSSVAIQHILIHCLIRRLYSSSRENRYTRLLFHPNPLTLRRYKKHRPNPQLRWLSVNRSNQSAISSFSVLFLATYRQHVWLTLKASQARRTETPRSCTACWAISRRRDGLTTFFQEPPARSRP